jgi:hypothetical protein
MEIRGILIGNDKNKKEEIENVRRNWKVSLGTIFGVIIWGF